MSSIAAGVNAERTNRWLLIGALVLAVLAGVLVFALLANFGGDDDSTAGGDVEGPESVLVANQTIRPGTTVTEEMFDVRSFDPSIIVPSAVSDTQDVVGLTATTEILEGNQVSFRQFAGGVESDYSEQLTFKVPEGLRGYAVDISEETAVGGLLVPSDRVDVIVQYKTKDNPDARTSFLHTEVLAENVEVLARAQTDVEGVAQVDPTANDGATEGEETDAEGNGVDRRPSDVDPDAGANTVTLALTPEQVLLIDAAKMRTEGVISLALRRFGDDAPFGAQPVIIEIID